jgi:hypothetical protein
MWLRGGKAKSTWTSRIPWDCSVCPPDSLHRVPKGSHPRWKRNPTPTTSARTRDKSRSRIHEPGAPHVLSATTRVHLQQIDLAKPFQRMKCSVHAPSHWKSFPCGRRVLRPFPRYFLPVRCTIILVDVGFAAHDAYVCLAGFQGPTQRGMDGSCGGCFTFN